MAAGQNIFPVLRYDDASAAIDWLKKAFGLTEVVVYKGDRGEVVHAELELEGGIVMIGAGDASAPSDLGAGQGIYAVVADPDAHHARAQGAGAEIVRPLTDQEYGSREYSARDVAGYVWSFGTYRPDTRT
jgi:uncharacterized glyoxalase superfamily protein PhnB